MTVRHDWLGNEIKVGSPVLYAISEGHFAKVVWGEVLEIIDVDDPEPYFGGFRSFKLKIQSRFENVDVLATSTRLGRGIETGWADGKTWRDPDARLAARRVLPKPSIVKNVEKVTVFPLDPDVLAKIEAHLDATVEAFNVRVNSR